MALATQSVAKALQDGAYWTTLGIAQYRAGDWKAAVQAMEKALVLHRGGNGFDWFFLAMAHWQLGDKDQARKWYDQAIQWMEKNKRQEEELRRLRFEAAGLMTITGKAESKSDSGRNSTTKPFQN